MISRLCKVFVVLGLVLSLIQPMGVHAQSTTATTSSSGSSATEMAQSMLAFFRSQNATITPNRVTETEMKVYGIFLSNLFLPYSTMVSDLSKNADDNSFPAKISTQFFGSTANAQTVAELNKILEDAISKGLADTTNPFGLYASVNDVKADKVMSGQALLDKISGKDTNTLIYNKASNPVIDVDGNAFQAVFKIIFGLSPEMFLSKDKGLRKMTQLHMDGIGNIWGKVEGKPASESVIFVPASLNPVTFAKGISTPSRFKLPLANTFAMGAFVSTDGSSLTSANLGTPYYNALSKMNANAVTSGNATTIYGVHSPTTDLGKTDDMFKGTSTVSANDVKNFLEGNSDASFSQSKAKVLITTTVDMGELLNESKNGIERPKEIGGYLLGTLIFGMSDVSHSMYYFNNPYLTGVSYASDSDGGDWTVEDDLFIEQTLFYKKDGSNFRFYKNSNYLSPMANLMTMLAQSGITDGDIESILSSASPLYESKIKGKEFEEVLRSLLLNYTLPSTVNGKPIGITASSMALMYLYAKSSSDTVTANDKLLYGVAPKPEGVKANVDSILHFFRSKKFFQGGFTQNDSILGIVASGGNTKSILPEIKFGDVHMLRRGSTGDKLDTTGVIADVGTSSGSVVGEMNSSDIATWNSIFMTTMVYEIFGMSSSFSKALTSVSKGVDINSPWGNFQYVNGIANGVNNYMGLYWGYMVDLLDIKDKDSTNALSFKNDHLPYMFIETLGGSFNLSDILTTQGISADSDANIEQTTKDLIKKLNSFLTDTDSAIRNAFFKNTQNSWFLTTHQSIVGSWTGSSFSVSVGGNGGYTSVLGFVTTPSLKDLPFTAWLLDNYFVVYLIAVILCFTVLLLMCLVGVRSIRESLGIFVIMLMLFLAPQYLIQGTINITNSIGDKMFSDRFTYWALVQHKQAEVSLTTAQSSGNIEDYIMATSINTAKAVYSEDAGVRVKWMTPKRSTLFTEMMNSRNVTQSLSSNLTIFKWLFSTSMTGDEYVMDDPLATYIYRPYTTIAQEALTNYNSMKSGSTGNKTKAQADVKNYLLGRSGIPPYQFSKLLGQTNITLSSDKVEALSKAQPFNSGTDANTIASIEDYRYWSLVNSDVTRVIFSESLNGSFDTITPDSTDASFRAFTLSTESPYYYFYNALKSRTDGSFRSSLLSKTLFKSVELEGYENQLRDFLDLEGLFSYVVPYLKQANSYVYSYTSENGKDFYDLNKLVEPDKPTTTAEQNDPNHPYNVYQRMVEHNNKLTAVWSVYSPWVDQIYSGSYVTDTVSILGKKRTVYDTLNPSAYEELGRPMVFSLAQAKALGYPATSLTSVEMKMQQVLEDTYRDMMYLINYYDLDTDDTILLSASAMLATFNFNKVFSENSLVGEGVKLYPLGYELKNFNYDAFLRLILVNATGEPMLADKDLYVRILSKTSFFTGLLLIISDVLNVIVLPVMRILILLLLFLITIVVVIFASMTSLKKLPELVWGSLLLPLLKYMFLHVAFLFAISLLMGEGLVGYVGSRLPTFGVTDPTLVLGILTVLSLVYIVVLFKLSKVLYADLKDKGGAVLHSAVSMAKTLAETGIGMMKGARNTVVGGTVGALKLSVDSVQLVNRAKQRRELRRRHKELISTLAKQESEKDNYSGDWIDSLADKPNIGNEGIMKEKPAPKPKRVVKQVATSKGSVTAEVVNKPPRKVRLKATESNKPLKASKQSRRGSDDSEEI